METSSDPPIARSYEASRELVCALLAQQTPVRFAPRGPSMHPLIRNGDHVRIVPMALDALRPGHIVLYRTHGRVALHRLIRRKRSDLTICADAALVGCEHIHEANLLGVADTLWRAGGKHPLDTRLKRWFGLARYYMRPLRRWVQAARKAERRRRR